MAVDPDYGYYSIGIRMNQILRRWPTIGPALGGCLVFAGICPALNIVVYLDVLESFFSTA